MHHCFFIDGKAIVPSWRGPQKPVSKTVRPGGGALVSRDETLGALAHDFHIYGLVPSVTPKSDVPDNVNDSFYKDTLLFRQTAGTTWKQPYK